ncbi:hypothetical protein HQ51_0217570 [Bacillus altitudinis]|nr:hypothetical protein HQ51_0217570 [Bacillus altitudinis]MDH6595907.1 hypothetical protein [Bacillus aerius]
MKMIDVVKVGTPPLYGKDIRSNNLYPNKGMIMFVYHETGVVPRKKKSFVSNENIGDEGLFLFYLLGGIDDV